MLHTCVLSWKGSWEDHVAFCMVGVVSPLCWETPGEKTLVGPDWIQQMTEKIQGIRQSLLTSRSRQKSYANVRRRDLEFTVGDQVLLKYHLQRALCALAQLESLVRGILDLL
jgi:hypothetical protein